MNATKSRIERTIVTDHHVEIFARREGTDNANEPLRIQIFPDRDGITVRCLDMSGYEVDKVMTGSMTVQIFLKDQSPKY